jgi:hypothetical protein
VKKKKQKKPKQENQAEAEEHGKQLVSHKTAAVARAAPDAAERQALKDGLIADMKQAAPHPPGADNPNWRKVSATLDEGVAKGLPNTTANHALVANAKVYHHTLSDPDAIVDGADYLFVRARMTGKTPAEILEERYGPKFVTLDKELRPDDFLKVIHDGPFLDGSNFVTMTHGTHIHLFQMLVLDLKHGPGTGRRFWKDIAEAEVHAGMDRTDFRRWLWDGVFDEVDHTFLNSPEALNPILVKHLGFVGDTTPRKMP